MTCGRESGVRSVCLRGVKDRLAVPPRINRAEHLSRLHLCLAMAPVLESIMFRRARVMVRRTHFEGYWPACWSPAASSAYSRPVLMRIATSLQFYLSCNAVAYLERLSLVDREDMIIVHF